MYGALLGCLKLSSIVLLMPSQEAGRGATAASAPRQPLQGRSTLG